MPAGIAVKLQRASLLEHHGEAAHFIHEAVKGEDGSREQEAEIFYVDGMNYQELCRYERLKKSGFIVYNDWTSGISKDKKDKLILHLHGQYS